MKHATLADWLGWQETLHPKAIDLGLDRLLRTLAKLRWQRPPCPVITIAGTNGKGSTVAMLARILAEQGYRTATFTSPHLLEYNERVCIAERSVSDASLIAAFERIEAARGEETLTFFEFNTLAALLIFQTANPDVMILEVGMGGRLDAVNIVDADVAVITSIALDHCEWLGNDVEAIGREKAGILRSQHPAIYGDRHMPDAIAHVASDLRAPLFRLGHEFDWTRDGEQWEWRGFGTVYSNLPAPALQGEVQFNNASAVIAALTTLHARLPLEHGAIERGLRTVTLSGRFQRVPNAKSAAQWIVDVAHNPAAAQILARQLANTGMQGRTIAVCSILGDKDIEGIAVALKGCIDEWIVCSVESPRALRSEVLATRLVAAGIAVAHETKEVADACRLAERISQAGDRIIAFGSFLTVAAVLKYLGRAG
jgi:dihydrofolate synthase / folylpolyglutamate synthase